MSETNLTDFEALLAMIITQASPINQPATDLLSDQTPSESGTHPYTPKVLATFADSLSYLTNRIDKVKVIIPN